MILVVEDDAVARGAMRSLLAACGYEFVAVETAEEAVRLIADGQRPSAAVVDWDLPGMSGLELIEHMERTAPETRAVLVTGAARDRVEAAARKHGVTYLRKPLNFKTLLQMLPAADKRRNKRGHPIN